MKSIRISRKKFFAEFGEIVVKQNLKSGFFGTKRVLCLSYVDKKLINEIVKQGELPCCGAAFIATSLNYLLDPSSKFDINAILEVYKKSV